MHMISKKDLSDAEMDTLTKSCSLTIVIIANGEVQTHEEAIVYVKEFDIFLTMKVLDNTPAELSLGKLCDENGYSYEWINGQKPHPLYVRCRARICRSGFNSQGSHSPEGAHFSGRVQERILNMVVARQTHEGPQNLRQCTHADQQEVVSCARVRTDTCQFQFCDTMGGVGKHQRERCLQAEVSKHCNDVLCT